MIAISQESCTAEDLRNNLLQAAQEMATLLSTCTDGYLDGGLSQIFVSKVAFSIANLNEMALNIEETDK